MLRYLPTLGSILLAPVVAIAQFGDPVDIHADAIDAALYAVEVYDLDGDGIDDLLLTTTAGVGRSMGSADGSFSTYAPIQGLQGGIQQVLMSDLTGDGVPDIIYSRTNSLDSTYVILHENLGGLSFGPARELHRIKGTVMRFEVADLDNDGDGDLLLSERWDSPSPDHHVAWKRNNGSGAMTSGGLVQWNDVGQVHHLLLVDLDGDGQRDIVAFGWDGFLLIRADGTGQFSTMAQLGSTTTVWGGVAADVDNDGDQDLLVQDNDAVQLYRNMGSGTFTLDAAAIPDIGPLYARLFLATGDLDQDGDADLVVGGRWYANDGTGSFSSMNPLWPLEFDDSQEGWYDMAYLDAMVLVDPDNDGDLDLLVANSESGHRLDLFSNNGQGPLGPPVALQPDLIFQSSYLFTLDVDHDGRMDVVASHMGGMEWFRRSPAGGLDAPRSLLRTVGHPYQMELADLDQDGNTDILYLDPGTGRLMVSLDMGGAVFSEPVIVTSINLGTFGGLPAGPTLGDVDGDGDPDLLVQEFDQPMQVFMNDGTGAFGAGIPVPNIAQFGLVVAVADINGDGFVDLVDAYSSSGGDGPMGYPLYLGNGSGGFTLGDLIDLSGTSGERQVLVRDLDGDGRMDLVYHNGSIAIYPKVCWVRNEGNGQWGPPQVLVQDAENLNYLAGLMMADVNGDGMDDIIYSQAGNSSCEIRYAECIGGTTFSPSVPIRTHTHQFVEEMPHMEMDDVLQVLDDVAPNDVLLTALGRPAWIGNFYGSPYRVQGRVFHDLDADGAFDANESLMPNTFVAFEPASYGSLSFSNGTYNLLATEGTYTVNASTVMDPLLWQPTTPASHTVTLTPDAPVAADRDFGYTAIVDTSIVDVLIVRPEGPCGGAASVWLQVGNRGTRVEHGSVEFTLDPQFEFFLEQFDPQPTTVSGSTLSWDLSELSYLQHFGIQGHITLPSVAAMGDALTLTARVLLEGPGGSVVDTVNADTTWVLECAYDPNDKTVSPAGYGNSGAIAHTTDKLQYTVRFQNTGTATAYHVVLNDPLPEGLDATDLQLVASSHTPSSITVDPDRLLKISFFNIMLPYSEADAAGSQGFITFNIGVDQPADHLTQISNTVGIVFDFNEAIITNSTLSTLVDCALWEPSVEMEQGTLHATEGDAYQWFLNDEPLPGATQQEFAVQQSGLYSVQVTSSYGCTAVSEPLLATGVEDLQASNGGLRAYPNPFRSTTTLHWDRPLTKAHRIVLSDAQGRVVRTMSGADKDRLPIHRNNLDAGLYTVQVLDARGAVKGRIRIVLE